MRQSKLFTKTTKDISKDEASLNAQLLIRAGFIDKLSAGIYTFLPLGWKVMKKIERIIREEMNKVDGQEIYMPGLVPKENWEQTNRWDTFDALYKLKGANEKEYGLGATHEEVVTPLIKKFVSSYKDLPLYVYQFQTKFRNELRAKSGLMRGREFIMKDLYSFDIDEDSLNSYYEKQKIAYHNIYKRCGLGELTYMTYADGGAFSKYSHEFQTITDSGEDIIYICQSCKIAINNEIIEDQNSCPECGNKTLEEKKAIEVGNIFKLQTRFSDDFDLVYDNKEGKRTKVYMGCYGIGLSRLMAIIAEIYNDNQGIIWPENIAPFKIHLISIIKEGSDVKNRADKIYEDLIEGGIEVLYDDREDLRAGEKFADSDLIGIPYRLVVSDKTLKDDSVEVKKRGVDGFELVKIDKVVSKFK